MPIQVVEHFESRRISTGTNPSAELRYTIYGTDDDVAARQALADAAPAMYDPWGSGLIFLPRNEVAVEPLGPQEWSGRVSYGLLPQTEDAVFNFDTGGGTQHITHSLATVASYAPPGKRAPDFKNLIGVTPDAVEGVEITVPVYQFSETHYLPNQVVTPTYRATLFALTGKVNNATFRGLAAGECLFLGAAGTRRGQGDWEIMFRFAGSPNAENLRIGDITGINKKGWEYLWVRYADSVDEDAKALVKKPVAVYVEKVYEEADFSELGI